MPIPTAVPRATRSSVAFLPLIFTLAVASWASRSAILPSMRLIRPAPAGFAGSLIVAEFPSLAEAKAWADLDPYVEAGVYAGVDVRPLKIALP